MALLQTRTNFVTSAPLRRKSAIQRESNRFSRTIVSPLPAASRPADYQELAAKCVTEVRNSNVHVYKVDTCTTHNQGRPGEARVIASAPANFVTCQPRLKQSGECRRETSQLPTGSRPADCVQVPMTCIVDVRFLKCTRKYNYH